MSVTERAWAAGFFDGAGSTSVSHRPGRTQLMTVVQQSGHEMPAALRRFHVAVGCGTVTLTRRARGTYLPVWRWQIGSISGGLCAMRRLWPYLGPVKKHQFIVAVRESARDFRLRDAAKRYYMAKRKNPTISGTAEGLPSPVNGVDNLPLPSGVNVAAKEKANDMPDVNMKTNDGDNPKAVQPPFANGKDNRMFRATKTSDPTPSMPGA